METVLDEKAVTSHVEDAEGFSFTPEEESKLLRKIDLFLMPAIFVLYLFSFVVSLSHFGPSLTSTHTELF
jgi:hypothetical protein